MAYYPGQKTLQEFRKAEKEVIGGLCSLSNIALTPESQRDHDRRIRREIANSNERRRMQSINAGFQSLKVLLPHTDGEKLSKAAILQQTAEYIFALEEDKTRLVQQNAHLKRLVQEYSGSSPKRKRGDESDEGIGSPDSADEELAELRQHLEKERLIRITLEEKVKALESQLQPGKLKEILHQAQLQQEHDVLLERRRQLVEEQQRSSNAAAQLSVAHSPPAPTQHPTVIVPAPLPPSVLQVNVVTMAPSSVISTVSTSKQNLDTIVQAIQHIEATEQGIKEEPVRVEKEISAFLNLDRMQEGVKEEREWHGLVAASPLIIKSSFGDAESESQDADGRQMLAMLRRPKVEVEPVPSVLVPGTGIL
ncbi:transcription factor AP-4-like isoform X2 [Hemiscyllium ocellatum]|uniref:transcription factor AP-4-like isoform X2 n=1 Tax=Hemiscyllium ocellatum TaxID=170820 RepID=UPI00296733EF|nr:transcription factor AP-4-like isoform X2 [Hemiscyllium ocellatum]